MKETQISQGDKCTNFCSLLHTIFCYYCLLLCFCIESVRFLNQSFLLMDCYEGGVTECLRPHSRQARGGLGLRELAEVEGNLPKSV